MVITVVIVLVENIGWYADIGKERRGQKMLWYDSIRRNWIEQDGKESDGIEFDERKQDGIEEGKIE